VIEAAGRASSSLICNGFMTAAVNTSIGLGMPNLPVAGVPGHPGVQSVEQLRENILGVTLDQVIANLTQAPAAVVNEQEPGARDIVFSGGFDAVNRWFTAQELSDGLPIVPPTRARIDAFLRCCDRDPDEVLGIILPDSRAATVWSVAVNGVMAGCRPQYMPLLIALAEAMADPYYGVEHSGNTPGGETLIMLNGPIAAQLGFNCEQGVMRDGIQANTSVGRFWRLYLRNIAGFLPGKNDKATFGNTWRVVVPENEPFVAQIGWQPMSVDMGFNAGDNTVTIARYTGGNHVSSVSGSTPEALMPLFEKTIDGFSIVFHMLSYQKIETSTIQSRACAGLSHGTYIFCLPGSPGACRDAWNGIIKWQLDNRHRPCNFVEIMPRLEEHRKPS
jgi:hypothetical protein